MAVQRQTASRTSGPRRGRRRAARFALGMLVRLALSGLVLSGLACGGSGVTDQNLPPGVQDPATLHTPEGALARYRGAVARLGFTFEGFLTQGAILTDELAALPAPLGQSGAYTVLDSRQNLTGYGEAQYDSLQMLRAQTREARGFVGAYAPDSSPALRGHLYALEGYAEIFLGDLFCSGIPLSTVDFGGDYTLAAGSTTNEVYEHAATLFDSALVLLTDSLGLQLQPLAAIGRGRALVALGRYSEAATAVAGVPDNYTYQVLVPNLILHNGDGTVNLTTLPSFAAGYATTTGTPSMADREGLNGLDYRSSGDPRIATVLLGPGFFGGQMYFPAFAQADPVPYTVANGIEARLIEAEAALQAGGAEWLTVLNALRTDGTFDTQPNASDPTQTDTLWHAGRGGVPGLRPLADPGAARAGGSVDLVFRERAFWLYLTGHRAGDLRRLIRQYGRPPTSVYPTGAYSGGLGSYGTAVTIPVPELERTLNPKYTGCVNQGA